MPRIYEALKEAEKERAAGRGDVGFPLPSQGVPRTLREKLLGTYHAIETALEGKDSHVVMFMSANPGEGCSTLLRQFAQVAGKDCGKKVLLLDADRGFGRHHEVMNLDVTFTAEDFLAGRCDIQGIAYPAADGAFDLALLSSSGSAGCSPISSDKFRQLLSLLKASYDLVLVDAPPFSASSDSLLLAGDVDGIVFVIEAEKTRWQVVQGMCDRLAHQRDKFIGVLLNRRKYHIPAVIYRRL